MKPGMAKGDLKVVAQDSVDNNHIMDVIGNKTDTTSGDSLIAVGKKIQAVTDVIPDNGAFTSMSGSINNIETVTSALPDGGALTTLSGSINNIETKTSALPDSVWTSTINISPTTNTRECSLILAGGTTVTKQFKITGDGVTSINLFSFTELINVHELKLKIRTVTSSAVFQDVTFEIDDGTLQLGITGLVDASGTVEGSQIMKTGAMAAALTHLNASTIAAKEQATFNRPFIDVLLNAKHGATNYIRLSFTGNAATDIDATACIIYHPLSDGASVTAV
jgi:hypothetical protein